jgi:hypothetical protein
MSNCYFCGKTRNDFNVKIPLQLHGTSQETSEELLNNSYKIGDYLSDQFKTDFATWTSSIEGRTCLICQIYWNPIVEVLIKTINEQKEKEINLRRLLGVLESDLAEYL